MENEMSVVIGLVLVLALVFVSNELSLFSVCGWFADEGLLDAVEGLGKQRLSINKYNRRMLILGNSGDMYISSFGILPGILAFYHVHVNRNGGYSRRIPIWSSTHRRIRRFYKEARLTERYFNGTL